MWSAPTLGGGRNELNLKWGRGTISSPISRFGYFRSYLLQFCYILIMTVLSFNHPATSVGTGSRSNLLGLGPVSRGKPLITTGCLMPIRASGLGGPNALFLASAYARGCFGSLPDQSPEV